jgi:hypothetical protein
VLGLSTELEKDRAVDVGLRQELLALEVRSLTLVSACESCRRSTTESDMLFRIPTISFLLLPIVVVAMRIGQAKGFVGSRA